MEDGQQIAGRWMTDAGEEDGGMDGWREDGQLMEGRLMMDDGWMKERKMGDGGMEGGWTID